MRLSGRIRKNDGWKPTVVLVAVIISAVTLAGCSGMNKTQKGALVGAGAGAVAGGAIGKAVGSTAQGAIVGAVVGGTAGAIIGKQMDKQAKELDKDLEDAHVQRVGEGIVVTFDSGILFDFDSADLQTEAKGHLAELAESMQEYPDTDLLIVGHSDNVGSESYNRGLSRKRAQAAADYLVTRGLGRTRVETAARGESEPIASNDTEAGRQQNRRVEVAVYASEEYRKELQEDDK